MLYLRMGLMLIVNLFTVRVVMAALGEVDFGIYNAVGGIVAMFSFISGTMSTACQRFYMLELGRGDHEQLRNIFNLSLLIFALFSLIVLLMAEPLGLWFLRHKMLLAGRDTAADRVFHCSVLSFMAGMLRLPFQGMVIARERMNVFAYISVFEALASLGIALWLQRSGMDRLVLYACLMLGIQCVVTLLYAAYCRLCYSECRWRFYWNREQFMELFSFAGWNMIGTSASVLKVHGSNVLLNMFFGPAVNAARGLAFKVYGMVLQLQENFMTASKPQIIKSYSSGEREGMKKLVYQSAKFSMYLMLFVSIPIMLEMPFLLGLWLEEVPAYTASFAVIMLVNALVDNVDFPVWVAIQATGRIKYYQITVGTVQLLVLPIAYLLLKWGTFPPELVFYVAIAISIVCFFLRQGFAWRLAEMHPKDFLRRVLLPVVGVAAVAWLVGWAIRRVMDEGFVRLLVVAAATLCCQVSAIGLFGLTPGERQTILERIRQVARHFKLMAK
ncbi:MAG: lipopolysaccharide biosynthesis protein [Bacteroidales bacterium]|nr:lipopolysaccharide biosynthesis protein [Bacteroidales bacterium]